jgi:hypothetical protein
VTRCPHCPADPSRACPGDDVKRFCELTDPAHADYRPAYLDTVRGLAAGEFQAPAGANDPVAGGIAAQEIGPRSSCCGEPNPYEHLI